jgi:phosphomannomutase
MITASHNPSEYNGFKICREESIPLSGTDGLPQIKEIVDRGYFEKSAKQGEIIYRDIMPEFLDFVLSFIDQSLIKPFKIAVDAGNGMAGAIFPKVSRRLPLSLVPLFMELDGTFPNHPANPIDPENTEVLRRTVAEDETIDLGVAFDGDADRMFLVDGFGNSVDASIVTAMVARNMLKKYPGSSVVYNVICSKTVRETIEKSGGKAIRTSVGHAIIKPVMRENNAIFGGEHSGHFYFRDFWFADSGLVAFLSVLELLSESGKQLSEIVKELDTYIRSGEINTVVDDREKTIERVKTHFSGCGAEPLLIDGVTFDFGDWWFNVRPSNTEPLIRLNLEADTEELMVQKRDEVLAIIRGK